MWPGLSTHLYENVQSSRMKSIAFRFTVLWVHEGKSVQLRKEDNANCLSQNVLMGLTARLFLELSSLIFSNTVRN